MAAACSGGSFYLPLGRWRYRYYFVFVDHENSRWAKLKIRGEAAIKKRGLGRAGRGSESLGRGGDAISWHRGAREYVARACRRPLVKLRSRAGVPRRSRGRPEGNSTRGGFLRCRLRSPPGGRAMRRAGGLAIWARFWLLEALPTRRWVEDILEAGGLGSESLAFICPSPSFWSFNILKEDLICESGNLLTKERADRDSAKLCDPGLREYSNGVWGPSPARDNVGPSSQALLVGSESRQRSFTYSRLVGSRVRPPSFVLRDGHTHRRSLPVFIMR